jgi:hypothetical protein
MAMFNSYVSLPEDIRIQSNQSVCHHKHDEIISVRSQTWQRNPNSSVTFLIYKSANGHAKDGSTGQTQICKNGHDPNRIPTQKEGNTRVEIC